MGWETRPRGGRYYTRSHKVGGRVVREYVGTGRIAVLVAAADTAERRQRAEAAAALRTEEKRLAPAEVMMAEANAITEGLAAAALLGADYHRHHRGAWRKRRYGNNAEE